jgi:hypothetical protein
MASIPIPKRLGMILLGIWLILSGLGQMSWLSVSPTIMAILAIIAGILVILDR